VIAKNAVSLGLKDYRTGKNILVTNQNPKNLISLKRKVKKSKIITNRRYTKETTPEPPARRRQNISFPFRKFQKTSNFS
jgi:hypothetical protein